MASVFRIVAEGSLTAGEDAAIRGALCVCFPPDREVFARTRSWHGTYPTWSVVVTEGEKVIAHAGVVEREIAAGEERVAVAGIQNVLVMPEHRGKQLFRRMMTVAMDEALGRDLDLGLLFCTPEIGRLYTKLDWRQATGRRVVCLGESGALETIPAKNVTMFYPLRRAELPPGDLDLLGADW